MSCNQSGFCAFGNSWWWIIILLLIFGTGNNGCGNSCDTGCGCGQRYMTQKGSGVSRSPLLCVQSLFYVKNQRKADTVGRGGAHSTRWEGANSPKITVKTVCSAGAMWASTPTREHPGLGFA